MIIDREFIFYLVGFVFGVLFNYLPLKIVNWLEKIEKRVRRK